jgi:hypothetical protein
MARLQITHCRQCGAPLKDKICEYCGTPYNLVEKQPRKKPAKTAYGMKNGQIGYIKPINLFIHEEGDAYIYDEAEVMPLPSENYTLEIRKTKEGNYNAVNPGSLEHSWFLLSNYWRSKSINLHDIPVNIVGAPPKMEPRVKDMKPGDERYIWSKALERDPLSQVYVISDLCTGPKKTSERPIKIKRLEGDPKKQYQIDIPLSDLEKLSESDKIGVDSNHVKVDVPGNKAPDILKYLKKKLSY